MEDDMIHDGGVILTFDPALRLWVFNYSLRQSMHSEVIKRHYSFFRHYKEKSREKFPIAPTVGF